MLIPDNAVCRECGKPINLLDYVKKDDRLYCSLSCSNEDTGTKQMRKNEDNGFVAEWQLDPTAT